MRTLKRVLAVSVGMAAAVAAIVFSARAVLLPDTDCVVSQRAVDDLQLEIGYDAVRGALGCDGVLASSQRWGPELAREVYHWRGDAWPFGRFDGLFYNGVLHGKESRWITITLGRAPVLTEPPAAPVSED